jgi:regulator of sigma E protease
MIFGVLIALFSLSLIIIFHELGHLLVAKRCRIKVECFSVGFGPKILKFRLGQTLYALSLIPFGGYVRMAGENINEVRGEAHEYMSHPVQERAMVVAAGSLFNLFFAFLLFWLASIVGIELVQIPAQIYKVKEGSKAEEFGFCKEDKILCVGKEKIKDWHHLEAIFAAKMGKEVECVISREGKLLKKKVKCILPMQDFGITPLIPPIIGRVKEGSPAQKGGILPGDKVLRIEDKSIKSWQQMQEMVLKSKGKELLFLVKRGSQTLSLKITPSFSTETRIWMIGVFPKTVKKSYTPLNALIRSGVQVVKFCGYVIYLLKELFCARLSIRMLAGPVGIVQMMSEQVRFGLVHILFFIGFLSINLAVLNMLPIPILDGGALLLLLAEKVKGAPLSKRTYKMAQHIGICIVLSLILLVTFNDIIRLLR